MASSAVAGLIVVMTSVGATADGPISILCCPLEVVVVVSQYLNVSCISCKPHMEASFSASSSSFEGRPTTDGSVMVEGSPFKFWMTLLLDDTND